MEFSDGCVICLEEYSYSSLPEILPCHHTVCSNCIASLIQDTKMCPCCRASFEKSNVQHNAVFIRMLIENDLSELQNIRILIGERVEEIIKDEIIKQQNIIEKIDKMEKEIAESFSKLRLKFEKIVEDASLKHQIFVDQIDQEINKLVEIADISNGPYPIQTIKNIKEKIKKNYINDDLKISLKLYRTGQVYEDMQKFADSLKTLALSVKLIVYEIPIFSTSRPLEEKIFFKPNFLNKNFKFSNLFDPLPGLLNIYDMSEKKVINKSDEYIKQNSICYQLHKNTICLVTDTHLLYIDSNKPEIYKTFLTKRIEGFCLGRVRGDIVFIGGIEYGRESNSARKVCQRLCRRSWVSLEMLKRERVNATAESINKYVYVIGGNPDMSIEVFDGDHWTLLPTKLSQYWSRILSCVDNDNIYLLGGENYDQKSNTVSVLNLSSNQIKNIGVVSHFVRKESDCYAVYVGNKIFYNFADKIFAYDLNLINE